MRLTLKEVTEYRQLCERMGRKVSSSPNHTEQIAFNYLQQAIKIADRLEDMIEAHKRLHTETKGT